MPTDEMPPSPKILFNMDETNKSNWWKVKRFLYNAQSLKEHQDNGELLADEITNVETQLINHSNKSTLRKNISACPKKKKSSQTVR